MDKVYIVTSGCYSDYHIVKVFKTKKKADEFAKWTADCQVEAYELSEDEEIKKYNLLRVTLKWGRHKDASLNLRWSLPDDYEIDCDSCRDRAWFYDYSSYELCLLRYIEGENINKKFYERKFTKAAYDIRAQIQAWLADGLNARQIDELFKNKIEE